MWFPLSGNSDFGAFDKIDPEFGKWLQDSANKANSKIDPEMPSLKLWHLNGSQSRIGAKQALYTFYELDQPTEAEINLAKFQDLVYFSSNYSANKFKEFGVNAKVLPVGFDEDLHKTGSPYFSSYFGRSILSVCICISCIRRYSKCTIML
jgi:hypothetical protein